MAEAKETSTTWGSECKLECTKANHPHDAYLKLYKKQYKKSCKRNKKSKKNNNTYDTTITILNPIINEILFNTSQWTQHFKYKHKNINYLKRQKTQTFYEWYCTTSKHQIPKIKSRNKIAIISITDDKHIIDHQLLSVLTEIIPIFYGLQIKYIPKLKNNELSSKTNDFGNFETNVFHKELTNYYNEDTDLFCVMGITYNIGIYSNKYHVLHGESNEGTQTSICSFSKIGIYNKNKIPNWLKIRRTVKLVLHEIGHLIGMGHCEYFKCLMNHNVILDVVPMILCPICLNKLYFAMIKNDKNRKTFLGNDQKMDNKDNSEYVEFDLLNRYKMLFGWFTKYKIFAESEWCQNRINSLSFSE